MRWPSRTPKDPVEAHLRTLDERIQHQYDGLGGLRNSVTPERRVEVAAGAPPVTADEHLYRDWLATRIAVGLQRGEDSFTRHWSDPVAVTFRKRRLNDTVFGAARTQIETLSASPRTVIILSPGNQNQNSLARHAIVADVEVAVDMMHASGLLGEFKGLTPEEARPLARAEGALIASAIAALAIEASVSLVIIDRGHETLPLFSPRSVLQDALAAGYVTAPPVRAAAPPTPAAALPHHSVPTQREWVGFPAQDVGDDAVGL
jgi:hypothetical protein